MSTGLLSHVRVIENASVITGPLAGLLLSDLGAEVIKVEIPDRGDQFRQWDTPEEKISLAFATYNRGKRSMTLNLRSEEGREIYKRLTAEADVVIENFRPGMMDALGIGYSALRELNPGLIYCEITGLGASGPYIDRPTFDAVAQGFSGLWSNFVDLDNPEVVGPASADHLTGIYAACATLAALAARANTNTGTKVAVNMLSSSMSFVAGSFASYLNTNRLVSKTSRSTGSQAYAFLDLEGKPLAVHLSTPKKFWAGLCRTVGLPELVEDDRFNSKAKRVQRYGEIRELLAPIFATRDRQSWIRSLVEEGVPCAPILAVNETLEDPQVKHLNMLWKDPVTGYEMLRSPIEHEGGFVVSQRTTPILGESTGELLKNLGYEGADLERLQKTGII